ncbi:MAG: amino acid permease [Candidatus Aminicenantes bacterium]|nr:amino acid permease [Candidatus Aminicenantes bacterium]
MNEKAELKQEMGLLDATSLVIGSVIGSGIFMTTGFIIGFVKSPGLVLLVWVLGGLITLTGALSFAELAGMFPKAGGQFIYLKEAYGDWSGFLFGWAFFWVIMCGGIAALAVGFAEYMGYFFPSLSNQAVILKIEVAGLPYSLSVGQFVAVGSIFVLSAVNYFGIKSGILVQNVFVFMRIASIAVIVILGWIIGRKSGMVNWSSFFETSGTFEWKSLGLALFAVLWTYDGWYAVNCTAGEVKKPEKTIPLSLMLGTGAVVLIYLLVNSVYLAALPVETMSDVARVGELAATALFGQQAASLIAGAITIAIFGCLAATILYGPRVYYAMADAGLFFRSMIFIHPRYRVPTRAILWQGVWASILCLSGTYQTLYEYVVFALVLFFAATGAAVFVLRFRKPDHSRPYKTWGYPVVPLVFVIINLMVFLNSLYSQPRESFIGLLIILAGVPAFLYWQNKLHKTHRNNVK